MEKGKLHKLALERLEYLMDKEENSSTNETESNEIAYLIMYIELFEEKHFPIETINMN